MANKKYNFENKFTKLLNGPYPFFVIRFGSDPYYGKKAMREKLANADKDGLIDIWSYQYLLRISRLIQLELIPEAAIGIDKFFECSHWFIFMKNCAETIAKFYEVLEKETIKDYEWCFGSQKDYHWKLVAFISDYKEMGLAIPKFMSLHEISCGWSGHPTHDPSTSAEQSSTHEPSTSAGQLLNADEQPGGEESDLAGVHDLLLHHVPASEKDFELAWETVEEALQKLYVCNRDELNELVNSQHTYIEEVKRHVAEMSQCHSQTRIYKQLEESLVYYLIGICTSIDRYEGYEFLQEVHKRWVSFHHQMAHLQVIFQSVGPDFSKPIKLGLSVWEKYIVQPGKLISTMAAYIRTEMDFENYHLTELKEMLKLYYLEFQKFQLEYVKFSCNDYLIDSELMQSRFNQGLNKAITCNHWKLYFQYVDDVLDKELKTAETYLDVTGQLLLRYEFHSYYFTKCIVWLRLCLSQSIEADDYSLIGSMHFLLSRFPIGCHEMRDLLVSHVEESCSLLRDGLDDDAANGEHLLVLSHKYDQLFRESLNNDKSLVHVVNSTFKKIVNSDKEYAKYMTAYIDSRLRQTITLNIEQEIESAFNFSVKHVNGTAFKWFYWQYMADRMMKLACSYTAERKLIEMMITPYGSDFTDKLEKMLVEMEQQNSVGFNSIFTDGCPNTSFMMLDSRYWPVKQQEPFNLPLDARAMVQRFESQFVGRSFMWQTHLGSATVTVIFSDGQTHDLVVSTPQMSVLMLFNAALSLTYREIQEATGMSDANLRPCLQSLLSADGTSILTIERHSENEFCENDILSFNEKFNGELDLSRKHEFEPDKMVETVDEAQKHHIEAAIARIMKSEKSLDHIGLVTAVTDAIKPLFTTTPAEIKRGIENLIETQLLEREQADPSRYKYV